MGRACHMARLHFEKALGPLAFAIYRLLYRQFRWGRELVFIVERKD